MNFFRTTDTTDTTDTTIWKPGFTQEFYSHLVFPCTAIVLLLQFLSLTGIWSCFGVNPKPKTNVLKIIKYDEQIDGQTETSRQTEKWTDGHTDRQIKDGGTVIR